MQRRRALFLLGSLIPFLLMAAGEAQDVRSRLKGLVYEAEDWSQPKSAWEKDKRSPDKWCLWTTEGKGKRSGDQSLVSPRIEKDRATPEEGAPPLHMHITGVPSGTYLAYLSNPTRTIAFSLDGKTWERGDPRGEIALGLFDIKDGAFDVWVDDRYACPANIGSCYFDYVRLEPAEPVKFRDLEAFTLPDGRTQLSWTTSLPVPSGVVEYGQNDQFDHAAPAGTEPLRNHRVLLPDLAAGQSYQARVRLQWGGRLAADSPVLKFIAGQRPLPPATRPMRVKLAVAEPSTNPRTLWPVTSGVPFARGTLARVEDLTLRASNGVVIPAQFEATSFWPDGSVKWVTVSFLSDTNITGPVIYELEAAPEQVTKPATDLRVEERSDRIILSNAKLRFTIAKKSFALFDDVRLDRNGDGAFSTEERVTGTPALGGLRIVAADGSAYGLGAPDRITVEESGPIRAVVRVEGNFAKGKKNNLFRYRLRPSLYSRQPFFGVNAALGNNNTAQQPATLIQVAGMRIPVRVGERPTDPVSGLLSALFGPKGPKPALRGSIDGCPSLAITREDALQLLQDYDNRFTFTIGGRPQTGEHSLGIAQVEDRGVVVTAFVKNTWQAYPKGIAVEPDGIHVRLLPPLPKNQYSSAEDAKNFIRLYYWCRDGLYQFRAGMEYMTDVFVRLDPADPKPSAAVIADHLQNPLFAAAEPRTYCESGAFGPVDLQALGEFDDYSAMVERGYKGVEESRQKRHEYGWMNFGDWFGERKYNWGNSEYDLAWCMALQFARSGDLKYLWRGQEMTSHHTTIDTIHYPIETSAPGVVYAHSAGHVGGFFEKMDARFKPAEWKHSYGSGYLAGAVDPGGHIYQPGNLTYGYLMGDRRYVEVAERVVTQQAKYLTRNFDFGIERAAGWPLINAVSAYQATGNPFYLNAAHIYLEKIRAKQDVATGGWKMPQGGGECDCPNAGAESHMGGKAFATGILLHGLILYDQVSPSEEAQKSIVRAADWLMNCSWNKEKQGFRYKTGCPKYQNDGGLGGTGALVAEGIAYAYEVTKDPKYKDFLLSWLGRVMTATAKDGKSYAQLTRQLAPALHYVKGWGVTELPRAAEPKPEQKP